MSSIPIAELPECEKQELLCTYASLILFDEKLNITSENITKLIENSNNTVLPYLPMLFERALKGKDIESLLSNLSAASSAAVVTGGAVSAQEEKKEEKKEEKVEEEEEEEDLCLSLFG